MASMMSCPSCFLFQHSNDGCCEICGEVLSVEQEMTMDLDIVDGRDDAGGEEKNEEEVVTTGLIFRKTVVHSPRREQQRNQNPKKRPPQSPTMSTAMPSKQQPYACPWGDDIPRNKPRPAVRVATPMPSSKRPRLTSPRDSPLKEGNDEASSANATTGLTASVSSKPASQDTTGTTTSPSSASSTTSTTTKLLDSEIISRRDSLHGGSKAVPFQFKDDILSRRDSLFGDRHGGIASKAVFPVHDLTTMRSASSSFMLDDINGMKDNPNEDELWLLAGSVFPIAAAAASEAKKMKAAAQEISPSTPKKQPVQCPSAAPSMPFHPTSTSSTSTPPQPRMLPNNTMSSSSSHRYSPGMMCVPIVQQQQQHQQHQQQQPRLLFSQHIEKIWSAKLSAPQRTDILVALLPVTKTAAHRWRVHYEKDHPPTSTTLWKMILKCADALGCQCCRRDFDNTVEDKGRFLGWEKWKLLRENLIAYFDHETFVKRHIETIRPLPREQHQQEEQGKNDNNNDNNKGMECLVCCERYHPQDVSVCTGTGKHGLCNCCLRRYVTETSPARDLSCVVCPEPKCTSMLPPAAIQENLSTWDKLRFRERRDAEYNNSLSPAPRSYSSPPPPPPTPRDARGRVASPTAEAAWSCECGASGIITKQAMASGRVCCTGCRLEFCVHCGNDWHTGDCPAPTNDDDDDDDADAQWQKQEHDTNIPTNFGLAPAPRPGVPHGNHHNYYFYYNQPAAGPVRPMSAARQPQEGGKL